MVCCSCSEKDRSDYVEFSNFNIRLIDRKMKRACGAQSVGPVGSDSSFFRVTFRSNDVFELTGFEASYQFTAFAGVTFSGVYLLPDAAAH